MLICKDRDNKVVSEATGLHEVGDVAAVEEVEDSVGEDDFHAKNSTFAGAGVMGNVTRPSL